MPSSKARRCWSTKTPARSKGQQGTAIQVRNSKNDVWVLQTGDETKIAIEGEAEPECIRPGSFVQFTGDLDKKGKLTKEIAEIELLDVNGKPTIGVFSSDEATPEARPLKTFGAGEYRIRGKVLSFRGGELVVMAGRSKLTAETSKELAVKVNSDNLGLAQSGDTVKVKAFYYPNARPIPATNRPGQGMAAEITITLSKPMVASGKRPKATERPAKSTRTSAK